jgi:zinc protease
MMRLRLAMDMAAVAATLMSLVAACALLEPRAWEERPPPVRDVPVVQPGTLQRDTLDNDLHVLVLEDHRLPRVSIGLTARRGAGSVPPDRAGLAVFTAELMKRGAGERDALALAKAVDDIGASLSVSVDWDAMTVMVSGLSRDLDRLAEVLADVGLRPRFAADEALRARAERRAALERAKDNPGTLVGWHAARTLYPDHRYGRPLDGTPQAVATLDGAMAATFHRGVFVPNNAILFASGDISAEDWVRRARENFGSESWPRGPVAEPAPAPPERTPRTRRVVVVNRPDLGQARIVIAQEGIARNDPRRIAADLMNAVLGGSGFSSRLMTSVRAEAGLTYSVGSGFDLRRRPGPFIVSTFTRAPEVHRTVGMLLETVEGIRTNPPSEEELAPAKSYTVGRFGLSLETPGAVMVSLVNLDVYDLPADSLDTYRARVRAVDTTKTAAAARDLLHPQRAAIVALGPAEILVPQLESFGAVQVVEP